MSATAPTPDTMGRVAQGSVLLATKFHVRPARTRLVARARLTQLLDEGRAAGLILVSAPAGFGKTTLLAEWLGQGDQRACWLSLDAADNDLSRFLTYLIAALQQVAPGIAGDLAGPLRSPEPPPAEVVLGVLVNELALIPDDLILVLDDVHVITSPAIHSTLTFLLEHLPPNLHLVILSRADPPIPIARLRSRGQVIEIRADELRFTVDEAAAFLRQTMGLALTSEQAAALDARTEGWIAGLQMAALSMRGRDDVDGFIRGFTGTNRFILDFLVEEVLAREPQEVQAFLLQTAILNRLSGPLCDAVTGASGGQEMLERLERRNLFVVSLDDDRRWYRYHHLFADLLQARFQQWGSERVAPLLSRAAEWCAQEGQVAEAVSYALSAKDFVHAGGLIAQHWGPVLNEGEVETVESWLSALPKESVRNSAPLSLAWCWVLWLKGQIAAIEAHLLDAEAALGRPVGPEEGSLAEEYTVVLPLQAATLRSIIARYHNDYVAACAHAEAALAQLPENLPPAANAQLRALIFLALASAYDGAGDLERAVDAYAETIRWSRLGRNATGVAGMTYIMTGVLRLLGRLGAADMVCREALRFMQEQGLARLPATGILHVAMADLLVERNELEAAEGHLARANELGRRSGRLDAVRNAAPALVRLRLARGDERGALAAVDEAESALREASPLARSGLLALRANILLRQGALNEAAHYADEAVRWAGQDRGQTGSMVALAASRVLSAQSRPSAAVAQLTQSLGMAEGEGRLGMVIELCILRSLALARQGNRQAAEADLARALTLAEPEGYVRVFVDEGEAVAVLLQRLAVQPGRTSEGGSYSAQYLAMLLAACDVANGPRQPGEAALPSASSRVGRAARTPQSSALIEPLSERELEVLRLMAEGLTNEQIARRLIIALGTAKAHIHNISGKLGAQNRAHAVARAQELGLL